MSEITPEKTKELRSRAQSGNRIFRSATVLELLDALENEQFAHWQTQQALNTVQQETNDLRALGLYDLVGDKDQLRDDMVSTIKERDQLREHVNDLRIKLVAETVNAERLKLELQDSQKDADRLAEAVRAWTKKDKYCSIDKWNSVIENLTDALAQHDALKGGTNDH